MSRDARYRYKLVRHWHDGEALIWIMLNPSTADSSSDDPTIRRCVSFAKQWGFSGIEVYNLFALRSSNPRALEAVADPVGPGNDAWLARIIRSHKIIVAAWGSCSTPLVRDRAARVREILVRLRSGRIICLGLTATGQPRHPLFTRNDTMPMSYPDGAQSALNLPGASVTC